MDRPRLGQTIDARLRLPAIAAPMLHVSDPDLVKATCAAGVIGAFPAANARDTAELDSWLDVFEAQQRGGTAAPYCPNLIMRHPRLTDDLACLVRHSPELVITSVGSPAPVVPALHDIGCLVLADVATLEHAEKAIAAGADGLILLTAGAGGQTGWLNPFAFVRAVRAIFDGPLILAGGISDGVALHAAITLGCDLAYIGTRFIAAQESMADAAYKDMLVRSSIDDVMLTSAFTGLPTSMLRPSIIDAGLDPARLDESIDEARARKTFGARAGGPRRWQDVRSAGHSVSGVRATQSAQQIIEEISAGYQAAGGVQWRGKRFRIAT